MKVELNEFGDKVQSLLLIFNGSRLTRLGWSVDLGSDLRGGSLLVQVKVRNHRHTDIRLLLLHRSWWLNVSDLCLRNKPLMVLFHFEDCPHSLGESNSWKKEKKNKTSCCYVSSQRGKKFYWIKSQTCLKRKQSFVCSCVTPPHTSCSAPGSCANKRWAELDNNKKIKNLFCPAALKKVLSEDNEIQKILDEDFIVLNLVVS